MAAEEQAPKAEQNASSSKDPSTGEPKLDGSGKVDKRKQKAKEIANRAERIKELDARLEPLRKKRKAKALSQDEEFTFLQLSSEYDRLRIEQKRAQSSREQSRLASQARAKTSEHRAKLGEMLAREGLDSLLNPLELLGFLAEGAERATNAEQRAAWLERGTRVKAEREAASQPAGEPLLIKFQTETGNDVKQELRKAGFTWNKLWSHWEGLANFEQASALAEKHGGKAHRPKTAR